MTMSKRNDQTGMTPRRAKASVLLAAMTALTIFGCEQRPATNTDEIFYYVRNGETGAKVRRLDAEAQAYVDAIFAAYMALQTANAPINELDDLDALWALDSEKWRSEKDRSARLKAIQKWQADELDAKKKDAGKEFEEDLKWLKYSDASRDGADGFRRRAEHVGGR